MPMLSSTMPVASWMDKRDPEAEAKLLREIREQLGWSQEQTARRVGVTTRTYARWESGEGCQLAALELLERIRAEVKKVPPRGTARLASR